MKWQRAQQAKELLSGALALTDDAYAQNSLTFEELKKAYVTLRALFDEPYMSGRERERRALWQLYTAWERLDATLDTQLKAGKRADDAYVKLDEALKVSDRND